VIESGFIIFRVTHNKWWIVEVQGIGWPKWDPGLILIWTSSSTTCFNSHWLSQKIPQLPLVTFDHLCRNCKHAVSTLGLKIGVAERLWLQLGVDTLHLKIQLQIIFFWLELQMPCTYSKNLQKLLHFTRITNLNQESNKNCSYTHNIIHIHTSKMFGFQSIAKREDILIVECILSWICI
jgi:hypothetical protein